MASAEVILWGRTIGAATDEGNGTIRFQYSPDFIRSGIEPAPLSMPVNNRIYSFPELNDVKPYYGLPGMLADSLPDSYGNLMIREYLARYGDGRTSLSPVEKLCYTGIRGMGALEYKPMTCEPGRFDHINIDELTKLAEKILTDRKDIVVEESETAMKQLLQVGSSAGGARAKALVAWNRTTGEFRSGQINAGEGFGYWLLKFDRMTANHDRELKFDDIDSTRIEYAYYLMAKKAGINMAESLLYHSGDCAHFLTRRFDRTDKYEKMHMISLCGMAHLNFTDRHVYGYEDIASLFDRVGLGQDSKEEYFRRMVFGDMTFNFDDHVKNTSFLMNRKGQWSLAPAYDVTFAYDPDGRFTYDHQMLINGKSFGVTRDDYMASGKQMDIKEKKCAQIIDGVVDAVRSFRTFAEEAGIREEKTEHIAHLIESK